jgi:HAD superfamily hydrolase (TIGR01490 family)
LSEHRPIAAFDFDGTITQRDTLLGYLLAVGGRARTAASFGRHAAGMARGLRDDVARDAAKEMVVGRVLRGRHVDELDEAGARYASGLPARYRPDVVERITWHRDQGHELVIVSASLVHYLRPVAGVLGFDDVIGVELEFDDGGNATGRLARANVRGPQKAERLREWWGDRPATELWAYGNSSGDVELLEMADHATWIGRRATR